MTFTAIVAVIFLIILLILLVVYAAISVMGDRPTVAKFCAALAFIVAGLLADLLGWL